MEGKTIKIKLVHSPICTPDKHKRVVKGLGLRKLNQVVVRPDTPVFRGMVNKVPHLLVIVEEVPAANPPAAEEPVPAGDSPEEVAAAAVPPAVESLPADAERQEPVEG
jgi:large subunit ribosomal protein L30